MALHWDIGNVEDWKSKKDDDANCALLDMLIWGCMSVDCGIVNEKDLDEFNWRLRYMDKLHEYIGTRETKGFNPTREQLVIWQGLATNVTKLTRKAWLSRKTKQITEDIDRSIKKTL